MTGQLEIQRPSVDYPGHQDPKGLREGVWQRSQGRVLAPPETRRPRATIGCLLHCLSNTKWVVSEEHCRAGSDQGGEHHFSALPHGAVPFLWPAGSFPVGGEELMDPLPHHHHLGVGMHLNC